MEVNIKSGSIYGLICMEHEVPFWSETAVEGSSSNSYTHQFHLSTLPYRTTKEAAT